MMGEFLNDFIKNASPKTATKTDRIYDGITINELKLSEQQSFHYLFSKGIFICSFSKIKATKEVVVDLPFVPVIPIN